MYSNHVTRKMELNEKRGFTLIELLVVIAIIAILAAILFPVFARARENARRSSCQSNMKQIGLAIFQYTQDYDEKMPPALAKENGNPWTTSWIVLVQPYTKSYQVFQCPSDSKSKPAAAGEEWMGEPVSYAANVMIGGCEGIPWGFCGAFGTYENGNGGYWDVPISLSSFANTAGTIAVAEKHNDITGQLTRGSAPFTTDWDTNDWRLSWLPRGGGHTRLPMPHQPSFAGSWPDYYKGDVSTKHMETANFLFADGHVKALRPQVTFPTTWGTNANMWDRSRRG